jgi:hypothetical protein
MMNIQDAKDHIKDAIEAYMSKDDAGNYLIPRARQRPIMVMGAPGLGKTAIMSQIAAELGLGYVSYTITHHTRQSAIGLPMIEKETYGGYECTVTRYTMSEIITSVYDVIYNEGKKEGILFIDEINCVSETLAPAMLDLLQNKKFGPHLIPDGWVLVAAGNPPEFNDSAREFDVATLDRVRIIEVEPDTDVWLRYAMSTGINDSITYYLKVKPQNLLKIERTVDGVHFVTPRAWEDLSVVLNEYEGKGVWACINVITQYIRDPDIATEFNKYREFYRKYREDYNSDAILAGSFEAGPNTMSAEGRLAVISILIGKLNSEASKGMALEYAIDHLESNRGMTINEVKKKLKSNLTAEERAGLQFMIRCMTELRTMEELCTELMEARKDFETHVENAMEFAKSTFGTGPETVSLLTGLISCYSIVMFSNPGGKLYMYNDELLSEGRNRRIKTMMEGLQ